MVAYRHGTSVQGPFLVLVVYPGDIWLEYIYLLNKYLIGLFSCAFNKRISFRLRMCSHSNQFIHLLHTILINIALTIPFYFVFFSIL